MQTQLCLVSGQTAPNLLTALQFDCDRVVLFYTTATREQQQTFEQILDALRPDMQLSSYQIDAYDWKQVKASIGKVIRELGVVAEKSFLNYTCGTKPMALGAWLACRDQEIPCVYVDSQHENLIWADGRQKPIAVELAVEEYLQLYNIATDIAFDESLVMDWQDLSSWIYKRRRAVVQEAFELKFNPSQQNFEDVNRYISNRLELFNDAIASMNNKQSFVGGNFDELTVHVKGNQARFEWDGEILEADPDEARRYLAGGWFEEYCYGKLRSLDLFDDMVLNVTTEYHTPDLRNDSYDKNEYDILATRHGQLYMFEVKSGWIDQEAIYKIDSLKAGRYARVFLLHFTHLPAHLEEKCDDMGIIPLHLGKKDLTSELILSDNQIVL